MLRTIKGQMVVYFTILILSIYVLVSASIYYALSSHLMQNQLEHQTQTAEALCKTIKQWKNGYEEKSFQIISDDHVQELLRDGGSMPEELRDSELRRYLEEYTGQGSPVEKAFILDKNYRLVGTDVTDSIQNYIFDRISTAERNMGGSVWDSGYDANYVILYRKINDEKFNVNQNLGYFFLAISKEELLNLFDDYRLDPTQRFSLKGIGNGFEVSERGFFYDYYDNYLNLLHTDIAFDDWDLSTWTDKSVALAPTKDLFIILGGTLIGTLLVAVLLVWIMSDRITKPISIMKDTIHKFSSGDFLARVPVMHDDEIGGLAQTLNSMAERIQFLFENVSREEKQRRKIQLQTLEYQINPHFLYNTLDSINILARNNNDVLVAEIVTSLSRLFRLGLHQGQEIVPVRDEVMHVSYYLNIQGIRFEDQLVWKTDIDEDILDLKIIKFILQPCVENAINHGIRKRATPGEVQIRGFRDNEEIVFTIVDDGVGISEEKLQQIRRRLEGEETENVGLGFGLNNVHQRIRLHYGPCYGLQIDSKLGQGTTVTIRIPVAADEKTDKIS